jgi:flagellum-specific peptidoglycan hydrolase FlgJ
MVAELTGSYAADPAYAAKIKRYLDELESDPVTNGVPELSKQEQNHRGWVGNV